MARGKVREILETSVRWCESGLEEPITLARVTRKPNGWAASCWVCQREVAPRDGLVLFVNVASKPDALSGAVHNGECCTTAEHRASAIAAARMGAQPATPARKPAGDAIPEARPADPRDALRQWLGVGEKAPLDADAVRELVRAELGAGALAERIAESIAEELRNLGDVRPRVELRIGDRTPVELPESRHAMFDEALCVLTCPERMLWLVGPTGTGKSYMARMLADALGVRYFEQACYGASESALVGFPTADGGYVGSPTVEAVDYTREEGSKGALLCLDEIDGADESALLALNSLLGGDGLATPRRAGQGHTHRGKAPLYIVATANTEGSGYGTREYNARTKLDDATRDRLLRFRVWVDYDESVERAYVEATGLPAKVADALWSIRAAIKTHRLEGRHISTRSFKYLGEMHATHPGRWDADALIEKELATWTDEERAKVGFQRAPGGAR